MSKIKPKEFNINHGKKCGCYFCECKVQIGFNYYIIKNRARKKYIKHAKLYFEDLLLNG